MTVEQINLEWGSKFIETLNARKAAIVFAIGIDKQNRATVCQTLDVTPQEMKKLLRDMLEKMPG